jgi:hypothetical protein
MSGAARALHWQNQRACPSPKGVGKPLKICRDWDWKLQLFSMNEEFQVSASHQLALITSLPFVHTARRCPGLSHFEKLGDRGFDGFRVVVFVETNLIAVA